MQANTPFFFACGAHFAKFDPFPSFFEASFTCYAQDWLGNGKAATQDTIYRLTFDMLFAIGETTVYALRWGVPTLPRFFHTHTARVGMGGTN